MGSFVPQAPTIQAEADVPEAIIDLISDLETAWLEADGAKVASFLSPDSLWFDGTRSNKVQGPDRTSQDIQDALAETWAKHDQSSNGLIAAMTITELRAMTLGDETIVTYERVLRGLGKDHPFLEGIQ